MVQIKNKLKYLGLISLFALVAAQARAEISVINTDFFRKISIDGLNLNLLDWDKEISQWVVDWQPVAEDIYELGLYPSNSTPAFSLDSHQAWLYSEDQVSWQTLSADTIKANKLYLKKDINSTTTPTEIVLDKDKELVTITEFFAYQLPTNIKLISRVYKLEAQKSDFSLKFYYQSDTDLHKQIYQLDPTTQSWSKLNAYHNVEDKFIKQAFSQVTAAIYLAVFEEEGARDGIASFYDQSRYRAFGYKNGLFAASRHYPKGTKLKITRLLSGKSIVVTVNDYGPESRTGRLVDLDKSAFKQIASLGAGLIYVKVEPL